MKVGEIVEAYVNSGEWCEAQVIALFEDSAIVSGNSERELSAAAGRSPIGICLPLNIIRAKGQAKTY